MREFIAGIIAILMLIATVTVKADSFPLIKETAEKSVVEKPMKPLVPMNLTNSQRTVLRKAYDQAKADGHSLPELVQGVLLQESNAGADPKYKVAGNKGDEYYGLGQLKLAAAIDVMTAWPDLWAKYKFQTRTDDELKANLILNQAFNIEMTSKYLKLLATRYGLSGRELVNAYNRGPGGVKKVDHDEFHYAIGVEEKLVAMKVNYAK